MSQLLLAQGIWVPRGKGYLILPKHIVDCQFQKTFCRQGGINSSQMFEVLCLEHHFDVSTVKHIEKGFANQLVLVNLGRILYRLDDFLSFLCLAALWYSHFLKKYRTTRSYPAMNSKAAVLCWLSTWLSFRITKVAEIVSPRRGLISYPR